MTPDREILHDLRTLRMVERERAWNDTQLNEVGWDITKMQGTVFSGQENSFCNG